MFHKLARLAGGLALASTLSACSHGPDVAGAPVLYDACAPLAMVTAPELSAPERDGVLAGLTLWNQRAATHLSIADEKTDAQSARLPLYFQDAATPFHGFYDERAGLMFINRQLATTHERAVTIAHELGHAFGLVHVDGRARASVMNGGNLVVEPTSSDVEALAALWGRCAR